MHVKKYICALKLHKVIWTSTKNRIRSLYFDTINDKDYEEKEDGVRVRRKIRLRIYDADQDFAML